MKKFILILGLLGVVLLHAGTWTDANGLTWTYDVIYEEVVLTDVSYKGPLEEIVVPGEIYGMPVVSIASYTFERSSAKSIVLPDSVREIEREAFMSCYLLKRLTFGRGMMLLDDNIFSGVALGGVTVDIGLSEFKYNSAALRGSVKAFEVDAENEKYLTIDGALIDRELNMLLWVPSTLAEYTVPEGVDAIGQTCFLEENLKRLVVPASVTFIDEQAYCPTRWKRLNEVVSPIYLKRCKTIKFVIPEGVKAVQSMLFDGDYFPNVVEFAASVEKVDAGICSPQTQRIVFHGLPPEVTGNFHQAIGIYPEAYTEQWQREIIDGNWHGLTMRLESEADPNAQQFEYTVENGEAAITAFVGTPSDGELVIPSFIDGYPVTKIAERAFVDTWIPQIRVSGGIKTIGAYAFSSLVLESIVLEEGVEHIETGAFYGCQNLERVDIPDSVKTIDDDAFRVSDKFPVIDGVIYESEKKRILIGYPNWNGESSPFVGNYKVDENVRFILGSAFMYSYDLISLELPEGLLSIGRDAFFGCSSLHTLNLPEGLLNISGSAFTNCSALTSLIIPNSLTKIGWSTFRMCSGLQEIVLHDGITEIGMGAFEGCSSLQSIHIPTGLQKIEPYTFRDCSMLESVVLPDNMTSIGAYAFQNCSSMRSFNIPTKVTEIGAEAFWGCYNAQCAVHIPAGVKTIEPYTFMGCGWLTEITFAEGVTTIGEGAFSGATFNITSLHLPDTITSVGRDAFGGANNLVDLRISKNLKIIEEGAFGVPMKLLCLKLPEGVERVEAYAFNGASMAMLDLPESLLSFSTEQNWDIGGIAYVIFRGAPPECTDFNADGFENVGIYFPEYADQWEAVIVEGMWKNLTMREFKDGNMPIVDYICRKEMIGVDQYSYEISSLNTDNKEIVIPSAIDGIPVTKIGDVAFANAAELVSVVIPDSVTAIGDYAFENCPKLESVIIGNGVKSLGYECFKNCPKLANVSVGKRVSSGILSAQFKDTDHVYFTVHAENEHYYAFNGALIEKSRQLLVYARVAFGEFAVPEGVKNVSGDAFLHSDVTKIIFPSTLTTLDSYGSYGGENRAHLVFLGEPPKVESVHFRAGQYGYYLRSNAPAWEPVIINGLWKNLTMIPFDSLDDLVTNAVLDYKVDAGEVTIIGIKNPGENLDVPSSICARPVVAIAQEAFKDNTVLASVTLPEGLTSIGTNAFAGCTALREVVLPNGLETIAVGAFQGCRALESIVFPFGLVTIAEDAFNGCESLDGIALPRSLKFIEKNAFKNCTGLRQCSLNDGLVSIAEGAFEGAASLRTMIFPASLTKIEKGAFKDCTQLLFVSFYGVPPEVVSTETADANTTVFSGSMYGIYGCYAWRHIAKWLNALSYGKWESVTMFPGTFSFDIGASNTDLRRWLEGASREQGFGEGNFTLTLAADTDYETLEMARLLGVHPKIRHNTDSVMLSTLAEITEEPEEEVLIISADVNLSVSEITVSEDFVTFEMCISTTKGLLPDTFNPLIMPQLFGSVALNSAYIPLEMTSTSSWVVSEDNTYAIKQVSISREDYNFFKFSAE